MKRNLNSLLKSKILVGCIVCIVFNLSLGQKTKRELYNQKNRTLKDIKETHKILRETRKQKKATIGQLNAIKKQITSKENLITSINEEVTNLDEEIRELELITNSMGQDLEALKDEYGKMVYAASKVTGKYDKLLFLFSSNTFDQMMMRLKYMKFYAETRKEQLQQILNVKNALVVEMEIMQGKRTKKEKLLTDNIVEKQSLEGLKKEKDNVAKELSVKEKELKKEIDEKKRALKKLENTIEDIIRKEIEDSRKKAAENSKKKGNGGNKITLTPETQKISDNFASNKGRLIWPLSSGFISQPFGLHPHPVLTHVTVNNLGVDIQTNEGQKCRAVFQGKVTAVTNVPGMNQIVAIQHGEFMTVYARLIHVTVKVGEQISIKQEIGTVYTNNDGLTELQFQVWQNINNENPEDWLLNK